MGFADLLIDVCDIFRYQKEIIEGVTSHTLQQQEEGISCRLISQNARDAYDSGRFKMTGRYALLLPCQTDVKAGDKICVNGERQLDKPAYYTAGKPVAVNRHHVRLPLTEEAER